MIAGWKLRRELGRLSQQLRAVPEAVWEPFAQARHDRAFAGFPVHPGADAPSARMALLLIFQPSGIAASTLTMIDHLREQGHAVLVVSNAPLSAQDRAALSPRVWQILERPNFGYDFGGYRDGLRHLAQSGVAPERLVILNDSIWFPLRPGCDLLARAEAHGADIIGTVLRERGEARFLESYFYSISPRALRHPAFAAFWKDYRLTSNKYKVIRRGERGFSAAMQAAGLRLAGLYRHEDFASALAQADADLLRATLDHAALVDPGQARLARSLVEEGTPEQMRAFIVSCLPRLQFYSAFPVAAMRLLGYPVLKKSREPVSKLWRAAWIQAHDAGLIGPASPMVIDEARDLTRDVTP